MGPLSKLAEQFRQNRECPLSMDNMTEAVTLHPCAHTFNEPSIHRIPGFGGLEAPRPCEQNSQRITKVRIVNQIDCPICRVPAKYYHRNWALREVCQEIPALFGEEKKAAPEPRPVPAPKGTLKDRFETVVGGIIAGFACLWSIGFAMQKEMENADLKAKILAAEEGKQSLQSALSGIITLVVLAMFVGGLSAAFKK